MIIDKAFKKDLREIANYIFEKIPTVGKTDCSKLNYLMNNLFIMNGVIDPLVIKNKIESISSLKIKIDEEDFSSLYPLLNVLRAGLSPNKKINLGKRSERLQKLVTEISDSIIAAEKSFKIHTNLLKRQNLHSEEIRIQKFLLNKAKSRTSLEYYHKTLNLTKDFDKLILSEVKRKKSLLL